VGQGLDMMKEDFEMRRRIIETLDAQATLVIEGGQKIIYARCILSSDVCTLRPVAQVVVDTKHKPQLVLTARLVLDSAAKRPKAQIRGNRQDNTESILDKMAAFLVLLLFSLLFFLSLAYEDNNNRTGPRFVRTGDQDPGAGGRGPDRQRDRHVVVHLGQDSVVVRQGDPRPARNPFARTPWPWRCDRTSFQENGLQKRVLDLPGASRCRLSCLH
jgi:hypothetical protein